MVSFRLGFTDGVSVVADGWRSALEALGWRTYQVAGSGPVDHLIPGLAIDAAEGLAPAALSQLEESLVRPLEEALARADVVLVENLLSIPLNLPASRALARVLQGRPAVLHHHDPPWQRERFAHITELPPDDKLWRHVTINRLTKAEFGQRGLTAECIYNGFDTTADLGSEADEARRRTRELLNLDPSATLVAHPVRAIARKNVARAVALTEQLGGVYWLPGPAEEGYGAELSRILDRAKCPVLRTSGREIGVSMPDLYAASDVVAFPSTWEGFGNPPVEAAIHRRPCIVGTYPVGAELRSLGFAWYSLDEAQRLSEALEAPDTPGSGPGGRSTLQAALAGNRRIVEQELSLIRMTERIAKLFAPWASGS